MRTHHNKEPKKTMEILKKIVGLLQHALFELVLLLLLAISFCGPVYAALGHSIIHGIHYSLLLFMPVNACIFIHAEMKKRAQRRAASTAKKITERDLRAVTFDDKNRTATYNDVSLTYAEAVSKSDFSVLVPLENASGTHPHYVERQAFLLGIGTRGLSIIVKDGDVLAATTTMFSFRNAKHYLNNKAPINKDDISGRPSQYLYIDSFCINDAYAANRDYMVVVMAIFCRYAGMRLCARDHYANIIIYARVKHTQVIFAHLLEAIGFNALNAGNNTDVRTFELRLTNDDENIYGKRIFDWIK